MNRSPPKLQQWQSKFHLDPSPNFSLFDMRERLGAMVIGTSRSGDPVTADDLGVGTLPHPLEAYAYA